MPRYRILYIGSIWPETNASAAGLRNWSLLELFCKNEWEVLYASDAKENEFRTQLETLGARSSLISPNDPAFDQLVAEFSPDFVLFDRFMTEEKFSWRVRAAAPNAVRVLDTIDLHFLRRERQKLFFPDLDIEGEKERELASIFRSDLTWVVSDFERNYLLDQGVPADSIERHSLFYKRSPKNFPAFEQRKNFCFIGNFRHPPNFDAVQWLKREIWPALGRLLPDAELHVYGAYPSRQAMALHEPKERFHVKGPAVDQYSMIKEYRLSLAPLRFGAGVKGKISDSWWCGTPVISTPIGAEGMGERESVWGGAIASSALDFAREAAGIYCDPVRWNGLQLAGYTILEKYFDEVKQGEEIMKRLAFGRTALSDRRSRNIVGSLLWHHAHQSSHYFSKWIELKRQLASPLQN